MRLDPDNGNITSGEYGFEDVINKASPTGTPDGVLEIAEDVDQNRALTLCLRYGVRSTWERFESRISAINTAGNPYQTVDCLNGGRQNIVYGCASCVKAGRWLAWKSAGTPWTTLGGFTVASETRFTSLGNYNSDNTDPFWLNPPPAIQADINHSAAAVIADSVTLLSTRGRTSPA